MEEPGFPTSSRLSPSTPRKQIRRRRTVFSEQQLRILEEFFEGKPYGTYEERETLAARLNLQEYQVLVWLKNRRARDHRLQRLRRQQGQGAHAAPQEPAVCAAQRTPEPAGPASHEDPVPPSSPVLPATPVRPEEPVFPPSPMLPAGPVFLSGPVLPTSPVLPTAPLHHGGPGFYSLFPHRPLQVFTAADPSTSSYSQACWDPVQGIQCMVPAPAPNPAPPPAPDPAPASDPDPALSPVPAPAPDPAPAPIPAPAEATLSPQGPDNTGNFSSDPDFTDLLSAYCFLEEPLSSPRPWYDFVGDPEVDLFQLLDLRGSVSPPSPADAAGPEGTRVCAHAGARRASQCVSCASCSSAGSAHL